MLKGLGSLANLPNLLKQAQSMGERMQQINETLKSSIVTGSSGASMVEVDSNGLGAVLAVRIAPELMAKQDRELLEDLIRSACNAAQEKAKQLHAESIQSMTGGLEIPGLSEAMNQLGGASGS